MLLERPALIARVKEHVSRELPPEAIHNEGLALQLFGFVPTQFDYEAAEYRLLQDQLAGYYEPADGTMYMASDLGDEEADATLAHELVHALQDQRWDLERRSQYRAGDGDHSEAVSALAEGDATSAMFDIMIARGAPGRGRTALDLPDEVFTQQIREGMNQGPGASAPRVMRSSLAAPYIYGTLFVHALRRRGGWAAVDRAWDDGPTTSEQIMHPEKWIAHEPPMVVGAPTFATLGDGWKVVDEDSEGELGTRIAFEEWMEREDRGRHERGLGWRSRRARRKGGPGRLRVATALQSREGKGRADTPGLRCGLARARDHARPRSASRRRLCLSGAPGSWPPGCRARRRGPRHGPGPRQGCAWRLVKLGRLRAGTQMDSRDLPVPLMARRGA